MQKHRFFNFFNQKKTDNTQEEIRLTSEQSSSMSQSNIQETHLLELRKQIENVIQECIARPASRLFRIGRESYLIYSGSTPDDQTPYILLGNSENLPPEIIERLEYLLISDNFLGDIFLEKDLLKQLKPRKNGVMRLVGDASTIKNLLKFFQMDDIEYLVPQKHSRRSQEVEIQPHQSLDGQRQRERIIASFYENGNIRVTSQKKVVLDLRSELQHGLNQLNEIRIADKTTTKWETRHLKRGFFNIAGDLVLHDAKNFMLFDPQNQDILLRLGLWGLTSSNCKGIFFHKTQEKGAFLHTFQKILSKVWIITKNQSIARYEQFFNKNASIKIFQSDEQIALSNYYTMELRLDESRFFLSPGKRYHDIEVNLSDFESSFDARIVLADRPVVKVPKERQIWIYRSDFPVKFYHPYILALPENYRYELRKIHKYIDVEELEAELREWTDASNESFPRPFWREFIHELIRTVERLQVNAFQNYEVDLSGMLKTYKKSNFGSAKEAWKNLISFNRLLLRWQMSGRRETFDTLGILSALSKEGFPHFGMIILFDDGQLITMYLPERLPGAYVSGMANPLAWQIPDLMYVKSYETIKDRILKSDLIYFLKLFEEQMKAAPLTDIQQNNWREGYAQWLQYYIQVYRNILQDLMRLETLYRTLSDFNQTQSEINQANLPQINKKIIKNNDLVGEKDEANQDLKSEKEEREREKDSGAEKKQEIQLKKGNIAINKESTDFSHISPKKDNSPEKINAQKQGKLKEMENVYKPLENFHNELMPANQSYLKNKIVAFVHFLLGGRKNLRSEDKPVSLENGSLTEIKATHDKEVLSNIETTNNIETNDPKETTKTKRIREKIFLVIALLIGIGLMAWYILSNFVANNRGVPSTDYNLESVPSWIMDGGRKTAKDSLKDGLTVSLKLDKSTMQNWQWLLDRHPFLPQLRQFFRDDFNYNPSILVYLNRMSVLNGYAPYSDRKSVEIGRGKNPHWIYPENRLIKPDQSIWIVKRGQNFWKISEIELKKRAQFFLYYLAHLDLALEELSKMQGFASSLPILNKHTFLLLQEKKNQRGKEEFSHKSITEWEKNKEAAQSFWAEKLAYTGIAKSSNAQIRKSLVEALRYEPDYESRYKQELPELKASPESFALYINYMIELANDYSFSGTQKNLLMLRATMHDFIVKKRTKTKKGL